MTQLPQIQCRLRKTRHISEPHRSIGPGASKMAILLKTLQSNCKRLKTYYSYTSGRLDITPQHNGRYCVVGFIYGLTLFPYSLQGRALPRSNEAEDNLKSIAAPSAMQREQPQQRTPVIKRISPTASWLKAGERESCFAVCMNTGEVCFSPLYFCQL